MAKLTASGVFQAVIGNTEDPVILLSAVQLPGFTTVQTTNLFQTNTVIGKY